MMRSLLFTEGNTVFYITVALSVIGLIFWVPLFLAGTTFFLFSYYFFRDPDRLCPQALASNAIIIAPADGTVVDIITDVTDMAGYATRISIFLSLWDVHVNWAPISGRILSISYRPGTFTFAYLPKSSEKNERNDITLLSDNGGRVLVRQIAGALARRISCWVKEGQTVSACQKIGMIRFGSRVDLFLPKNSTILVKKGEQVYGGQTIVAQFMSATPHQV